MGRSSFAVRLMLVVILVILVVNFLVLSDVVVLYNGSVLATSISISAPITVIGGSCPCGSVSWSPTSTGFSSTITAFTMNTTSGYVLTTPLVVLNASSAATMTMTLSTNTAVVSDYINGTQIYPGQGSISLKAGQNLLIQRLVLGIPVTSTITLSGQYGYSPTTGVTYYNGFTETINPPTSNVMNLLNGQEAWYVKHYYVTNTKGYPAYYGPGSTSSYWGSTSSITQPVLDLTPASSNVATGMFWIENYTGSPVTITVLGTYSKGSSTLGTGYYIYFFVMDNSTTKYWAPSNNTNTNTSAKSGTTSPSTGSIQYYMLNPTVGGTNNFYVIVQWSPQSTTYQWVLYVIQEWDGNIKTYYVTGTGYIKPSPGDYILICVTYYPSNKTFIGYAVDLNNGEETYFSYQLLSYYFTPGQYYFGVEAGTSSYYANWAITYVNYQG